MDRCGGDFQRRALVEIVERGPIPAIHGVVRWRLIDLVQWLHDEFAVSLDETTVGRELRKQAADAEAKLTRLYEAIENGLAEMDDSNLKGRIVEFVRRSGIERAVSGAITSRRWCSGWRSEPTKFGSGDRSQGSSRRLWRLEETMECKLRRTAFAVSFRIGSPGRIRTIDQPVNSRLLYR